MITESRCVFSEGSVTLPDGYKEQTVNILISPTGNAVNISRDDKPADET
ncbi:TPA: DcrB-related protein, partial [Providencia stuartii]|nr:DcrB-related protein [Providencia stuartii]